MLSHLSISDFAIIDRLEIDFSPGFTILTGETGTGKSIIVDAMSALLGGRADPDLIRAGSERALIEGAFTFPYGLPPSLSTFLEENELNEEGLILSREIRREGRAACRLNGRLITLTLLKDIGQGLIDIHNQGEHLSLLRVKEHLDFLDRYGGLTALRAQVEEKVAALHHLRRELDGLLMEERERARRIDLLRYQAQEIESAHLKPGEEEELERERLLLANAEHLLTQLSTAYEALYEGREERPPAIDLLGEAKGALAKLERLDPRWSEGRGQLEGMVEGLSELARALRSYREAIDYSPERLAQLEERLELIHNLKRKYGPSIAEVLAFGLKATQELEKMTYSQERIDELKEEERSLLAESGLLAGRLSAARREAAQGLSRAVEEQLRQLKMEGARFSISLEGKEDPQGVEVEGKRLALGPTGVDRAEFLISPNPGEPLRPLAKIASGGETSRLMLALKSVLSSADQTPTLIFDEIDAGLGGRGSEVIGYKLWALSADHQVLCVTHLPQIASFADAHFKVTKELKKGRTVTRLQRLNQKGRIQELAEMIGKASEAIHQSAQEIYQQAQEWKEGRAATTISPDSSGANR